MALLDNQELLLMSQSPYRGQNVMYCLGCRHYLLSMRRYNKHHLKCKRLQRLIFNYKLGIINRKALCRITRHRCIRCNRSIVRQERKNREDKQCNIMCKYCIAIVRKIWYCHYCLFCHTIIKNRITNKISSALICNRCYIELPKEKRPRILKRKSIND